ncbi:hypothetical protein ACE04B_29495, partial [Rhizobium phaseoli]
AVGFVFAANDADAELLEVSRIGGAGERKQRRCRKECFLQHAFSPIDRCPRLSVTKKCALDAGFRSRPPRSEAGQRQRLDAGGLIV